VGNFGGGVDRHGGAGAANDGTGRRLRRLRLPPPGRHPDPADGWSPARQLGAYVSNACSSAGGLYAAIDPAASLPFAERVGWVFDAPVDTSINNYTLYRTSTIVETPAAVVDTWLWHNAPVDDLGHEGYLQAACARVLSCSGWGNEANAMAPANRIDRSGLDIRRLIYADRCSTTPACGAAAAGAHVTVWASRFGLADLYAPAFTQSPSGPLLQTTGPVDGELSVSFRAVDHGSGIASVGFAVDGHLLQEQTADPLSATCKQPYLMRVPCPLVVDRTVSFNTTQIANGAHEFQVAVIDASGNRTLSDAVTVNVHNSGAPNGSGASRFARLEAWFDTRSTRRRTAAVVAYGHTRAITRLSEIS
jgi:hypothetical protein